MKKIDSWIVGGVCSIMLCGGVALAQQNSMAKPQPTEPQAATAPAVGPSAQDRAFVAQAYNINAGEVKLGKLAEKKGQAPAVKNFGKRMQGDHSVALNELKSVAHKAKVKLPEKVGPEQQQAYHQLSQLSGKSFDQAYIDHMVTGHEGAISLFESEAKSGQDPVLKSYAQKQLPMLKAHHDIAKIDRTRM